MIVGSSGRPVKHFMLRYRRAKYAVRGGGREIVWAPPWDTRVSYRDGDIVEYDGTFWRAHGTVTPGAQVMAGGNWSAITKL